MSIEAKQYQQQLDYLIDRAPEHHLRDRLAQGYSYTRAILLRKAVEQLPPPPVETTEDTNYDADDDPIISRLQTQLRYLFGTRAKLSNKYITTDTVRQRREINRSIKPVQDKITQILIDIDNYREKKTLPERQDAPEYDIPDSPVERLRKIQSIRAGRSRARRQLEQLIKDEADADKLASKRELLQQYEIHLMYLHEAEGRTDI